MISSKKKAAISSHFPQEAALAGDSARRSVGSEVPPSGGSALSRRRTEIYYLWRPNLPDEGDNHVLELAVAAGARAIVTHNVSGFARAELRFPALRVLTPAQLLVVKEDNGCRW